MGWKRVGIDTDPRKRPSGSNTSQSPEPRLSSGLKPSCSSALIRLGDTMSCTHMVPSGPARNRKKAGNSSAKLMLDLSASTA